MQYYNMNNLVHPSYFMIELMQNTTFTL